jgi:hypothetical protein
VSDREGDRKEIGDDVEIALEQRRQQTLFLAVKVDCTRTAVVCYSWP